MIAWNPQKNLKKQLLSSGHSHRLMRAGIARTHPMAYWVEVVEAGPHAWREADFHCWELAGSSLP